MIKFVGIGEEETEENKQIEDLYNETLQLLKTKNVTEDVAIFFVITLYTNFFISLAMQKGSRNEVVRTVVDVNKFLISRIAELEGEDGKFRNRPW